MSSKAIGDYALLSDCRSSALEADGSIDWLCFPRFDSPPVFARLLDDQAGHFLIQPTNPAAPPVQRYRPQTLVLETTWTAADGVLVLVDALALGSGERGHSLGRSSPGVLLRTAHCTQGTVEVHWDYAPRPEFGLIHPQLLPVDGGIISHGGATTLFLSTENPVEINAATATGTVVLQRGERTGWALQQTDP